LRPAGAFGFASYPDALAIFHAGCHAAWAKSSQCNRLARFSHSNMQRERDDATLPKIWTPRDDRGSHP
jgi:hypothetical protein